MEVFLMTGNANKIRKLSLHADSSLRLIVLCLCTILMAWTVLPAAVYADSNKDEKVRIGYYENEVFQEGAKDGAAKNGYAYEYYQKISEYTGWRYEYVYEAS